MQTQQVKCLRVASVDMRSQWLKFPFTNERPGELHKVLPASRAWKIGMCPERLEG
jgi:hypothetical protein